MIKMKSLDYSSDVVETDCGDIVIASALSPDCIKASAMFGAAIDALKESGVELEVTEDFGGVEIKAASDQYKALNAALAGAAVIEWPISENIDDALFDNQMLCNAILNKSMALGKEFNKKKLS